MQLYASGAMSQRYSKLYAQAGSYRLVLMLGYYQACADNAVAMATKRKSRVRQWLRAIKGLFVKLDDDVQYEYDERGWH
jgi:flagellar biosynthesis/type III secretory pathway ATPase